MQKQKTPNKQRLIEAGKIILAELGCDLENDNFKRTPERFADSLVELYAIPEPPDFTEFDANGYDQMIVEKGIKYYTACAHHVLPFFGEVKIGYIPNGRIVGLSKLARTVEYFAHRLNTQEYLTQNIADFLWEKLKPKGLGVIISGTHLCKVMRGAKATGVMVTTALKGSFLTEHKVKEEFLNA